MKNPLSTGKSSKETSDPSKNDDYSQDLNWKSKRTVSPPAHKSHARVLFYVLTGLLVALLIGGFVLVYFLISIPKQVRAYVAQTQPLYEEYRKDMRSILEHLESDEEIEDIDGLEREIEKAKQYVEGMETRRGSLEPLVSTSNVSQIRSYRKDLETYIERGDQASNQEKNELKLAEGVLKLSKDIEALEEEIQRAIEALFFEIGADSRPVQGKILAAIDEFKNLEISDEYEEAKNLVVRQHELQLELLKKIQEASDNRNADQLEESFTWLEEQEVELEKDMNRVEDEYKVRVRDLRHEVDDLEAEITREYNRLDAQYKF